MLAFLRRDRGRLIFRVRIGRTVRRLDPMRVEQRLEAAGTADWPKLVLAVEDLRQPVSPVVAAALGADGLDLRRKKFAEALAELVRVVRLAFRGAGEEKLPELAADGSGFTDGECVAALTQYLEFTMRLAEDARPLA